MKKPEVKIREGDIIESSRQRKYLVINDNYGENFCEVREILEGMYIDNAYLMIKLKDISDTWAGKEYCLSTERWYGPTRGDIVERSMLSEEIISLREKVKELTEQLEEQKSAFSSFKYDVECFMGMHPESKENW